MAERAGYSLDLDRLALEECYGVLRRLAQFQRRLNAKVSVQEVYDAGHEIVVSRKFREDKPVLVVRGEFLVKQVKARNREESGHDVEIALAARIKARVLAYEVKYGLYPGSGKIADGGIVDLVVEQHYFFPFLSGSSSTTSITSPTSHLSS